MKTSGKAMIAMALLASVIVSLPSAAEEAGTDGNGIPAYSVARLKIFEGSIWVRPADSGDWEEYLHNSPVAERSRISVPEGSEAELQFHGGQFLLLSEGTEIDILGMRENGTEFRLRYGEIKFYLPESDFAPVRLTVPEQRDIDFPVPGQYWVTAGEGRDSSLVVRSGESTVEGESGRFPVNAGEMASIGKSVQVSKYAGGEGGGYKVPPPLTEEEKSASIPPAAAYELREYGEWVETPEYGTVWRPRVSPGWTPYYYGRWVWVSPYGWTWVAYEPWGWYPYHYGYWYDHASYGWVWYPYNSFISFSFAYGDYHYPHYHGYSYYYPACVRYVRDGRTVRWVPLRPGERQGSVRYTRADKRLAGWNRPLREETVYVRREGNRGSEWRDVNVVQREQQRSRGSRTEALRERGGVQERAARPDSVEGSGRGKGTGSLEGGRVPSVRTESGKSSPTREFRSRDTRPGNTGRPSQFRLRNEAPARGRGSTGSSGSRGTFSRITRGEEQAGGDDRVGVRPGNAGNSRQNKDVRGRSEYRGNNAASRPSTSSRGGNAGGSVSSPRGTRVGGRVVRGSSRTGPVGSAGGTGGTISRPGRTGEGPVIDTSGSRSGSAGRFDGVRSMSGGRRGVNVIPGTGGSSGGFGRSGSYGGIGDFGRGRGFGGGGNFGRGRR